MKKKLALILAAVIALSTASGCSADNNSATSITTSDANAQTTTAAEESSPEESNAPVETEEAATTSVTEQTSTAATTTAATTTSATTAATTEPVVEERPEDIKAKKHIIKMESYNTTDNLFDASYFYDNPTEFFHEGDDQSYGIILNDVDAKTNSAQNQIQQAYVDMANMSLDQSVNAKLVFTYFNHAQKDLGSVIMYRDFDSGYDFSDGKNIILGQVMSYLPYYMQNNANSTDGSLCFNKLMEEMSTLSSTGEFFSNVTTCDPAELYDFVPYYYTVYCFGYYYDDFEKLGDVELEYSTPILVPQTDDYKWNFFTGTLPTAYVIPFRDVTNNVSSLAYFDSNNNLINLC